MTKSRARIRLEEFKREEVKLTSSEIHLIMLLRENYLTVAEFAESARVGVEIQAEASNNDYYNVYKNKIFNIFYDLISRPL